jgi:hypothetical protein
MEKIHNACHNLFSSPDVEHSNEPSSSLKCGQFLD